MKGEQEVGHTELLYKDQNNTGKTSHDLFCELSKISTASHLYYTQIDFTSQLTESKP